MRKLFSTLCAVLMLSVCSAWAADQTWTMQWNKGSADGGEGFKHISNNTDTIQETTMNGLLWVYQGSTSVTAFSASMGQAFGSAKSPLIKGSMSTNNLKGKIKQIVLTAKAKEADMAVHIAAKVNGVAYAFGELTDVVLTDADVAYTFVPQGDAQEGLISIEMAQPDEPRGMIYFSSLSITYEGTGIAKPDPVKPGLAYAQKEMTVEAGDNAYANPLTNPNKVAPIKYKAEDESIAVIGDNGNIFTIGKVGDTKVNAIFAGDEKYLPDTASYTLHVVAKPVIAKPEIDIKGGTFDAAQNIVISSNDPLCQAIWYSITAKDSAELVDDPEIFPGNEAHIKLDRSCILTCCAVGKNNIGCVAQETYVINIPLQAEFSAQETKNTYYKMGWDNIEDATTWHYYGINEKYSWTMTTKPTLDGTESFKVFDPASVYSLSIIADMDNAQRERAVSPDIQVRNNSVVEFYACFSAVWLHYANWYFRVNDATTNACDTLLNAFEWSQEQGYTGPNWIHFEFALDQYAGHDCKFEFLYEGVYGDDMSIDGFAISQQDTNGATVTITEGQSVHFVDLSQGYPTSWLWNFEGADVATSTEQNPVVSYAKSGTYNVSLTVGRGEEQNTCTKQKFIQVVVEAPKALIGLPEVAYLSPWAAAFVPVGVPVTFTDASTGNPTSWLWNFEGTDVATSTEQNPTVTYNTPGLYGLEMEVSNEVGHDRDFMVKAIQAGGALDVWNIAPDEYEKMGEVSMGWYGYYAGSNWVGMEAFAEHFQKPAAAASIDTVSVYFNSVEADDKEADIVVCVCAKNADGMPGDTLATTSVKVADLRYDEEDVVPTYFVFDQPVSVNDEFFVTIGGFPNTGYYDEVTVLCVSRGQEGLSTTYHMLADWDANDQPTGTYSWEKNVDEPISMVLTAHLDYGDGKTNGLNSTLALPVVADAEMYDLMGRRVAGNRLSSGAYIQRSGSSRVIMVK